MAEHPVGVEPPAAARTVAAVTAAAVAPYLVLHVEDDDAMRASVRLLLRSAGLQVVSVASGTEALQRVRDEQLVPDVLIVDFHLAEEMTGADVAEALARAVGHAPPTIVLTADPSNAELPWMTGAPLWMLGKPFDGALLLAGVDSLARFHRLTHAAGQ
jgi:CheY-like chemotaxis protein